MQIVYIILAHKLPDQLVRLIDRLDADWVTFFVHIDKKTDEGIFRQIAANLSHRNNVHMLKRFTCNWGGFGVVEASLEGLRQVFLHRLQPHHILLLTGQDYPLRTNESIRAFFEQSRDTSFIDYGALPDFRQFPVTGGTHLYERWHFVSWKNFHVQLPWLRRTLPLELKPYKGSAYWNITCECASYLLNFVEANPQVMQFFRYVLTPDELFFQTILMNARQQCALLPDCLRYTDWQSSPDPRHPKTLTVEDFKQISNSSALFARKFDETKDGRILQMLDAHTVP